MSHVCSLGTAGRRYLNAVLCLALLAVTAAHAATPGNIFTAVGTGTFGFSGDNGPGTQARLNSPEGLAAGNNGNIYIADRDNHCIRKYDVTTGIVTTVAGQGGQGGFAGDNGLATNARLAFPESVAIDNKDNLYIADTGNNRIRRVDGATGIITTLAGTGAAGYGGDGGPSTLALLNTPTCVSLDYTATLLYIIDRGNNVCRRIDLGSNTISLFAGVPGAAQAYAGDGGPALFASFSFDIGGNFVAVDPAGNVFFSDENNNRVRAVNVENGIIDTVAGNGADAFAGDGGLAIQASLDDPTSIALDGAGNLWIMDELNERIRLVSVLDAKISTVCGNGVAGFSGDGGPAVNAQVSLTSAGPGIIVNNRGDVFFSDILNERVRFISQITSPTPVPGSPEALQKVQQTLAGGGTTGQGVFGTNGTGIFTYSLDCPGRVSIGLANASTAKPNQGNIPIPCFTKNQNGGSFAAPVTVNPACSYLPVSTNPDEEYLYLAIWDFGDGTPPVVVPGSPTADPSIALSSVTKTYCGNQKYTITLRLDVTVRNIGSGNMREGASAFITGEAQTTNFNLPPQPVILQEGSANTGVLPVEVVINPNASQDPDGWIIWAAIDWGDGSRELISPLPPQTPPVILRHTYTNQGIYQVTLSVIDNGRMQPGTVLDQTPAADDPNAALTYITNFQSTLGTLPVQFKDAKFNPMLKQDFLLVQVSGSMFATKGTFNVSFANPNSDKLDVTLTSNVFADTLSNASVQLTIGSGPTALKLPAFKTDVRGRYRDQALGLKFDFNGRKRLLRLTLTRAALVSALKLTSNTVVNGNVDVPISIVVNGNTPLTTVVRFVYNASAGEKGMGRKGLSFPSGF
ncbi:MAG TPA: hypothetical protein VEK08_24110 [Planctomycetota bacterium]|nr:hypothetical protein [Planctomycetota bacterium]